MRRTLLLLLVLVAGGAWLIGGAGHGARREHVTTAGVPLDVVHPSGDGARPGVVVAHGFSGSARLMAPFGDTLAARGYVVVLLDLSGHGANRRPLPDQVAGTDASTEALQQDLGVAVAHLRSLPGVDPARIALVGHSMGAGAVTRYAAAHPDVTATVAISLPSAVVASAERPARLLTVVGALEFPGFRSVATEVAAQRADRAVRVVPGVEHITVLYAPETHRATVDWLDQAFGGPLTGDALPFPGRRLAGAAVLVLAFVLGLHPLLVLVGGTPVKPAGRFRLRTVAVAAAATAAGAVAAWLLPTTRLPLAIAGYVAAYATVIGAGLLAFAPRGERPAFRPRMLLTIPYAVVAVAVPVHLGLTHALPVGDRWWLLLIVWAAFALFAFGAERIAGGDPRTLPAIAAVFVAGLAGAAVTGLTHGFVVLVLVPLIGLLLWQVLWSVLLNRFAVPAWLIALTGAAVVSWPLAVTLPVVG
ncbi:dienelactone hydrolase family protein [Actinoplanes subglobosus]|uniref:Dienelactone hydrolase family protein n=1 Tax=Actinoplanes subglobosus TaxID=1547892 RepID=A0ABV8JCD4_9ACTN